jgi:hypothetical protein
MYCLRSIIHYHGVTPIRRKPTVYAVIPLAIRSFVQRISVMECTYVLASVYKHYEPSRWKVASRFVLFKVLRYPNGS